MANLTERVNQAEDENVWLFSGEPDRDFTGEVTFNDHGGVNQSCGDDSVGKKLQKEPTFGHHGEKNVHAHTVTTNWVRKRR